MINDLNVCTKIKMSSRFFSPAAAGLIGLITRILITSFVAIAILLLAVAAYRLLLHPLSQVPGPKYAGVSNIWLAYQVRNGRTVELGKELHRRYGEMVRVGPNEVWFSSKEAFDIIYNTTRGYEKSDFYLATALNKPHIDWLLTPHFSDNLDLLSELDLKRYRLQRRLIGRVYQTANLLKLEAGIDVVLNHAIARLEAQQGAEVELKEWMHMIVVECLGACVLSWSPGMLKSGTDWGTSSHSYMSWRRKSVLGLFPGMTKLGFCSRTLDRAFSNLWGLTFGIPENFKPFFPEVGKRISRRLRVALKPKGTPKQSKDERDDILTDLIQLHKDKSEFTETYLRKMAVTNFGAGHETMAATLTSVLAMIGTHKDVQKRVTEEIRNAINPTTYTNATQLQYTRAATKEAMRIHPVISMSLPRVVSAGGMQLQNHFFPAGTTVGCNPVALHSNEAICGPEPELYNPGRWLGVDATHQAQVRVMERYNLNWGGGSRTCPGRNLAELVVCKVVPALLERFDIEVTMLPESGRPSYFLSMLTGAKARFLLPLSSRQGCGQADKTGSAAGTRE